MPGAMVFGYGELGVAALDVLAASGERIVAAVAPGNRSGADVDRFTHAASDRGIPVWTQPPRRAIEPFVARMRRAAPDAVLVWSYSMLLPPAVLAIPPRGAVNVHSGLLPEYRGGHVVQWAILNGERESGVTLHYLDEGVDTGPIIAIARFPLGDGDDAASVRMRLKQAGTALLREWWPSVVAGTAPRLPQDESRARHWPLRGVEDGRIDWTLSSERICRMVRALACNQPGAFVDAGGMRVSLRSVEPCADAARTAPGTVVSVDGAGVVVATGDGAILVRGAEADGAAVAPAALARLLDAR